LIGGSEANDLKRWCDQAQEPVMIVIDVFAKVRAGNTKNTPLYEADYGSVVALQELAIERGIAVVLAHHDRKMEAEDPFDTVSGTLGLTGAADHPDPQALGRRGDPARARA
jgi:RecA-family ATPase